MAVLVEELLRETAQAVAVEHETVMVEIFAVLAPAGVNIEYESSRALIVCVEQDLLA